MVFVLFTSCCKKKAKKELIRKEKGVPDYFQGMECNKDEATRAKEIAERKFAQKDYADAKKFASKALNLYPALDGISQMLTTFDVYVSGENKINGEADWYGVLGVSPWADEETVRKQYRKLALMLHPDKNKNIGADGAFRLVSQAWSLLSDQAKRLAYNQRRNLGVQQKVASHSGGTSVPRSAGNATNSSTFARTQTKHTRTVPTSAFSYTKATTFWTVCNRCRTHFEYLRIYLNQNLLCPNCRQAFFALEKPPPSSVFKSSNSSPHPQDQNKQRDGSFNTTAGSGFQWRPFSRTSGVGTSQSTVESAFEKAKREHKTMGSSEWEKSHRKMDGFVETETFMKKRKIDSVHMNNYAGDVTNLMGNFRSAGQKSVSGSGVFTFSVPSSKPDSERDLSLLEIRNMLIERTQNQLRKNLKNWSSVTDSKSSEKVKSKGKERGDRKQNAFTNGDIADTQRNGEPDRPSADISDDTDKDAVESMSINVPDPDFHSFDVDRTESSFGDDEIWAAYDDDDGMPRFYARVHKVISTKPFKMRISWLNSRSNSEFGPVDWVGSGFTKTCGEFRTGKYEITDSLNSFSHKVMWTKGSRGVICIYPRKGDVWALYRNWTPDWDENTPDEVIHKYDMVQVLDDYDSEQGVSVAPLVKVPGFRTVFQKHAEPKEVRRIPKEEMFRFSHRVPTHLLTGEEAEGALKGCLELDPAATPVDLLQVSSEPTEPTVVENAKKVEMSA